MSHSKFYETVLATKEQADILFRKHLKPIWGIISKIYYSSFVWDDEDKIGLVTLSTITGKEINYQMRNGKPRFVMFYGFGDMRYYITTPEDMHQEMFVMLQKYGMNLEKKFWAGGMV